MSTQPSDLILARLRQLHPKIIDLSLGRVARLLAALDHPERRLPPVVHIAGTNGKGSTLAVLDAMLRAGGHRVDRYISPHLVRFSERILHDARPIAEPALARLLARCEAANEGLPITFFEITTAAAMLAFAERRADWALIETGLGGEFDATNVVDRPRLVLIAPVSMDHESYLGDTIEKIAAAKAGILKAGVPALIGRQDPRALAVIERRAAAIGAPLGVMGRDFEATVRDGRLRFVRGEHDLDLPLPALPGLHQIDNAGLAVAAALALGEAGLDAAALARGLEGVRWPARLQRLARGPMVAAAPAGSTLWLDGGHNPAAGAMLARSLEAAPDPRPLHLVVGMLAGKDAAGFLRPLAPLAASVRCVPIPDATAHDPAELAALANGFGCAAHACADPLEAVREIAAAARPCRILICGALYLSGQILVDHG